MTENKRKDITIPINKITGINLLGIIKKSMETLNGIGNESSDKIDN